MNRKNIGNNSRLKESINDKEIYNQQESNITLPCIYSANNKVIQSLKHESEKTPIDQNMHGAIKNILQKDLLMKKKYGDL